MTPTDRLLSMQDAASRKNVLGVTGAETVGETHAVAMFDATFEPIAQNLDSRMRVRPVADAALAVVTIMNNENKRAQRRALRRRQGTPQQHVAIVDNRFGLRRSLDSSSEGQRRMPYLLFVLPTLRGASP